MNDTPAGSARISRTGVETSAGREVRRAIDVMATEAAGRTIAHIRSTSLIWPGTNTVEPEPIVAIEAAHAIEQAAHSVLKDLIRLARQAGRNWYEIGEALDLHWEAVVAKESIADIAYDYALEYQADRGMRTFVWTCPACEQLITDQSPFNELPAQEEGHADDCRRWSAELAEWQRLGSRNLP
jgi:hypothetical protein